MTRSEILTKKNGLENVVSVQIEPLLTDTKYMVEAFSMRGEERLHIFGIPLEGGFVTVTMPLSSPSTTNARGRIVK